MTDPAIAQYVIVARRRQRSCKQIASDLGMSVPQVRGVIRSYNRMCGLTDWGSGAKNRHQTKQERRRSVNDWWSRARVNSRVKRATLAITKPEVRT